MRKKKKIEDKRIKIEQQNQRQEAKNKRGCKD